MHTVRAIRSIKWGIYATLLIPLLFTPFTFFPWHFGKTAIFQIMTEILLFFGVRVWAQEGWRMRMTAIDWGIIAFLFILVLTTITGIDPGNSFWGDQMRANGVFTWLHFGAWYMLLRAFFHGEGDWKNLAILTGIVGVLVSFTAFFQEYLPVSWQGSTGTEFFGILGNSGYLAFYLVPLVGISWVFFFSLGRFFSWRSWQRLCSMACAVLFMGVIIGTGNRGAEIALAVFFVTGFFFAGMLSQKSSHRFFAILLFCIALAGIVSVGMYIQTPAGRSAFPRISANFSASNLLSGTGATRLMAWDIARRGMLDRPLLGWGMGNYSAVFSRYYNPGFLKYSFSETVWDKPHNWLLEIGVSTGLLGLISYLCILIAAIVCGMRHAMRRGDRAFEMASAGATIIAYATVGFFLFESTNSLLSFFLLLAYIASMTADSGGEIHRDSGSIAPRRIMARRGVVILVGLLAAYFIFVYHAAILRASYAMRRAQESDTIDAWRAFADIALDIRTPFRGEDGVFLAEQLINRAKARQDVLGVETRKVASHLGAVLDEESREHPQIIAYSVWLGQTCMLLGETNDPSYYACAERAFLSALSLSPRKQDVLFLLGRLYVLKKDFSNAIIVNQRAVDADPSLGVSHWFLGLSYNASDDLVHGADEIIRAVELGYPIIPERMQYVIDVVDSFAAQKKYDIMIRAYQVLQKADPSTVDWYVKLAASYAAAGNKDAAMDTINKAIARDPSLRPEAERFIEKQKLR